MTPDSLSARLEILQPGATDYTPVAFNYHATRGTSDGAASSCSSATVTGATSVTTNTGGNSLYNGCWLTIEVQLPPTYSAPHPSTDSTTSERGWWKIRYTMGGRGVRLQHRPHDLAGRHPRQPGAISSSLDRRPGSTRMPLPAAKPVGPPGGLRPVQVPPRRPGRWLRSVLGRRPRSREPRTDHRPPRRATAHDPTVVIRNTPMPSALDRNNPLRSIRGVLTTEGNPMESKSSRM